VVVSQRSPLECEPLDAEGVAWIAAGCCAPNGPRDVLARLDADVLVADRAWWEPALADPLRRPVVRLAMDHPPEAGDWNLDAEPLHPWGWWQLPTRGEVRASWGVHDDRPVVVAHSPTTMRRWCELRAGPYLPAGAELRTVDRWRDSLQLVGADLIVSSAGWAASCEARWSGVPHVLLDVGASDQAPRATHQFAQLAGVVAAVRPAELPADHRADAALAAAAVARFCARLAVG